MADRTPLTPQAMLGPWAAVATGALDITFAAGDATNGNSFACTGKEILLAYNSDSVNAYTITIDSVDDEKGRQEDLTSYSLDAGDYAAWGGGLTNEKGWKQTSGVIHVNVENVAVKLAVLRLP